MDYNFTGEALTTRILGLIPDHPEILDMDDPFMLFKVEGFQCKDLNPSLMQASFALTKAKKLFKEREETGRGLCK